MKRTPIFLTLLLLCSCGGTILVEDKENADASSESTNPQDLTDPPSEPKGSCPPKPDCNWCKGKPRQDSQGCIVGYTCENGADACTTKPCHAPEECSASEVCLPDKLCWKGPSSCSDKQCNETITSYGEQACNCSWQCNDNRKYTSECKEKDSVMCTCKIDGVAFPWVCVVEEGFSGACGLGAACCGFPH